ncbi:TIGR03792 family protein [Gymnodinialimonas sp. 2305UL16-5]|uniref:TIGR03792 family protein n=1 Tax=Gymnodinialimonas mytili TaxID=3126503 RepID=UPI00309A52EC
MTQTIEHLTVAIPPDTITAFLEADSAVWTATLSQQPGYTAKEVWVDRTDPTRVHLIIRWESYEAWKSVPADLLAATDAKMTETFGHVVPVLSCTALDVLSSA